MSILEEVRQNEPGSISFDFSMKGGCLLWGLGIVALLVAAVWLFWMIQYPTYSYNFRMTVEVETPDGVKSGSSVYRLQAANTGEFLPEAAKRDWAVKGEAVAVDLSGGKTLFALLKPDLTRMSMRTLDPAFKNDIVESAARIQKDKGVKQNARVSPADYPMLVTFTDIKDPSSVARVDPDNLAASFGPGVRLKHIIVELTSDDVTTSIEERLASHGIEEGHGLDRTRGVIAHPTLAQKLGYNDFLRR